MESQEIRLELEVRVLLEYLEYCQVEPLFTKIPLAIELSAHPPMDRH